MLKPSETGNNPIAPLGQEEYVEQTHFFQLLGERIAQNTPAQEALASIREEILATTKLPMAIDFILAELRHAGVMSSAASQLKHYFTPFQTYIIREAEEERGRFDLRVGLEILSTEALYRSGNYGKGTPSLQGLFLYHFEVLCRNRLSYDKGLSAVAADPVYPKPWRTWIMAIRHQVGMIDIADLIYVQSEHAQKLSNRSDVTESDPEPLFGEREGRIALANRKKDPLYLFNSLHRQLGHPEVPRTKQVNPEQSLLPQMARRMEQLERRIKLLEEEQRGGFDLSQFYEKPPGGP